MVAVFLGLWLQCVHSATFECSLSMTSSNGDVQGAHVDLQCAVAPGTTNPRPDERPVVQYDSALQVNMTGDAEQPYSQLLAPAFPHV